MSEAPRQGVLLVEDDARYRAALEIVLGARWQVHATALARVGLERADANAHLVAAIVDLGLPDIDGVDLVRALRARRPAMPVIVLTVADTRERVLAAVDAGAAGYVLKEDAGRDLLPAVDAALAGGVMMSPRAAAHVVAAVRTPPAPEPEAPVLLTTVERRVLEELARGRSYAQIGLVLDISINTVRSRIRTLFEKLDVASSTEAITTAHRRGLIRLER